MKLEERKTIINTAAQSLKRNAEELEELANTPPSGVFNHMKIQQLGEQNYHLNEIIREALSC